MDTLDHTSLTAVERRVVEGLARAVQDDFGDRLQALWLYGSAARGDRRDEESDVDLLVVVDEARSDDRERLLKLEQAADPEYEVILSVRVRDRAWIDGRRAIDAFFIKEVDADRVVVAGAER